MDHMLYKIDANKTILIFFESLNKRAETDPVRTVFGDRPQALLPLAQ